MQKQQNFICNLKNGINDHKIHKFIKGIILRHYPHHLGKFKFYSQLSLI